MIKYNNPGNIRPLPEKNGNLQSWLGSTDVSSNNFVVFSNLYYGIRAYFKSLHTAVYLHGRSTIKMYITAYAPPTGEDGGNDTEAYISEMCKMTGTTENEAIAWNADFLIKFAQAQFKIETGTVIDVDSIKKGLDMANIIL